MEVPDILQRIDTGRSSTVPRTVQPDVVSAILAAAVTSNQPRQLSELFSVMLDTSPDLLHCVGSLQNATRRAPWVVSAWKDAQGEIPPEAQRRADVVELALKGHRPLVDQLETGFGGLLKHMALGTVTGLASCETLWEERREGSESWILPRAWKKLGAVNFAWEDSGLLWRPKGGDAVELPRDQVLVCISTPGEAHPAQGGLLRTLARYWIGATYGYEWLLSYGQLFGQPIRFANYARPEDRDAVCGMLANLGAAGWAAMPEGVKLEIIQQTGNGQAADLPQYLLQLIAREVYCILLLGQTLTTSQGDKGSQSLGNVHLEVQRGKLQDVCTEVGELLTQQLAAAVLRLNFGDTDFLPEISCDLAERDGPDAMLARAERFTRLAPLATDDLYEMAGFVPPAEGSAVVRTVAQATAGSSRRGAEAQSLEDPDGEAALEEVFERMSERAWAAGWEATRLPGEEGSRGDAETQRI